MCSEKSQTKTLRVKSDEIDTKQYEKFASSCAGRLEGQRPGQILPAIGWKLNTRTHTTHIHNITPCRRYK